MNEQTITTIKLTPQQVAIVMQALTKMELGLALATYMTIVEQLRAAEGSPKGEPRK